MALATSLSLSATVGPATSARLLSSSPVLCSQPLALSQRLPASYGVATRRRRAACARASGEPIFEAVGKAAVKDEAPHTDNLTVGDFMTTQLVLVLPSTTIEHALELLVEHRITGFPVVDEEGRLVGVVSDIDLLAIDALLGSAQAPYSALFPEADKSWKAFKEIQKLLLKTKGKTVGDVMTKNPITVRAATNLDEAARFLLGSQFRRLPVLDSNGSLVGMLTRGNVVKAALETRKSGANP